MNDKTNEQVVNIPQSEYQALMKQMAALTKQVQDIANSKADVEGEGSSRKVRRASEHYVTVLFLDGKPVIGLEKIGSGNSAVKIYNKPDPQNPRNTLLMANPIILDPKTNTTTVIKGVVWPEFLLESEKKECKVVKSRGERWVEEQGTTSKQTVEGDKYHMKDLGIEIPVEIEGTEFHYIVDVDGIGVEIHEDYVNMAKASIEREREYIGSTVPVA